MGKRKEDKGATIVPEVEVLSSPSESAPTETGLAALSKYDLLINKFKPYLDLTIAGPDDKDGEKRVDEARKEVKRTKTEAGKVGTALKAPLKAMIDQINAQEKSVVKSLSDIEDALEEKQDEYKRSVVERDLRIQEEAAAKIDKRVNQLITIGAKFNGFNSYKIGDVSISTMEIRTMDDSEFIYVTTEMEAEYERNRQAEESKRLQEEADKAERERKDAEARAELEAETQKLAQEKERIQKELDDLRKQNEALLETQRKANEAAKAQRDAELETQKNLRISQLLAVGATLSDNGKYYHKTLFLAEPSDFTDRTDEEWSSFVDGLPFVIEVYDKEEEKKTQAAADAEAAKVKAEEERVKKELELAEALKPDMVKLRTLINKMKVECSKVKLATERGQWLLADIVSYLDSHESVINIETSESNA